ncbi:hypothetical protein K1719_030962 [Acacia pycnantha]|nr:hypothetical protein K1719_030962 [Acacia pycnantha]
MNILSWNCRGAVARLFPGRVRELIQASDIYVLVLIETRVSSVKADRTVRKLGFSNWIHLEAIGYAGGIWILWHDDYVSINYVSSST